MTWQPLHCAKTVPVAQACGFTGLVVVVPHLPAQESPSELLKDSNWSQESAKLPHRLQVNCMRRVLLGLLLSACSRCSLSDPIQLLLTAQQLSTPARALRARWQWGGG